MAKKARKKKSNWPTLHQLETIIFRTMRIERPEMTREMARKAAVKIRPSDEKFNVTEEH